MGKKKREGRKIELHLIDRGEEDSLLKVTRKKERKVHSISGKGGEEPQTVPEIQGKKGK